MRLLCCVALLSLAVLTCPGHGQPAPEKSAAADLQAGNEAARSAYRAARERILAELGPIVLWDGDELVFRYGSYRRVSQPTPAYFHDLKTTGHMVLGLHALLAGSGPRELKAQQLFDLKRYRESVQKVRSALAQRSLTKPQLARQEKILAACASYLAKVIEARKAPSEDLQTLLHQVRPMLDENNADAVRGQLDSLHREMQHYRKQLSEAEWSKLRVLVQGSQQPRKDHVGVQYFARLLGEQGEGKRIIYTEAIFDENKSLALLGTKLLDAQVGQDIWDDPLRLQRDLLGEAARGYLNELFEKK